jgi:Uma2 family endonuclease
MAQTLRSLLENFPACDIQPVGGPPRLPRGEDLPTEDGIPLESNLHRMLINLLAEVIWVLWADRDDYFAGGNMFFYFSEVQSRKNNFRGPDFFVVRGGTQYRQREKWVAWEENGRYPDLIIELTSPSTEAVDRGVKKRVYELLRIPEYFIYDPFTHALEGYRMGDGPAYEPIPPGPDGRLRSQVLGLWLGTWEGGFQGHHDTWLRFFKEDGTVAPVDAERQAELRRQAEEQQRQAEERAADLMARLRAYEQQFGPLPSKE